MSTIAFDQFALTRIADFARTLSRLHQTSRRRRVDDDQFDREFNGLPNELASPHVFLLRNQPLLKGGITTGRKSYARNKLRTL